MKKYSRDILYSRMIGLVSYDELEKLKYSTVAVPGCGGVGFTHAESLARMGVGRFKIADFDTFGPENINRQFGASTETFGLKKANVLKNRLLSINPEIHVDVFEGVNKNTVEEFLKDVDFVCDALDYFVIRPRRLMYSLAYTKGIPVVMSGPIGFGATTHYFSSNDMTFDEFFDLDDSMTEDEMLVNFGLGINPGQLERHYLPETNLDFENKKVASVSSSCLLATVQSSSKAILTILGKDSAIKPVPWVYQIDMLSAVFHEIYVDNGVSSIKMNPNKYLR